MTVDRMLRLIAGGLVAASMLLGMYVHTYFHWFTLFVGLNLFQSAFTNWCPMMTILRRSGVPNQATGYDIAGRPAPGRPSAPLSPASG